MEDFIEGNCHAIGPDDDILYRDTMPGFFSTDSGGDLDVFFEDVGGYGF
jgi:hypothetical protein